MTDRWVLQSQGVSYLVGGHHEQVVSLVSVQRPPLGHVKVGFTTLREEGMGQGPAYRKDSQSQVTSSVTHRKLTLPFYYNGNTHTYWYFSWQKWNLDPDIRLNANWKVSGCTKKTSAFHVQNCPVTPINCLACGLLSHKWLSLLH